MRVKKYSLLVGDRVVVQRDLTCYTKDQVLLVSQVQPNSYRVSTTLFYDRFQTSTPCELKSCSCQQTRWWVANDDFVLAPVFSEEDLKKAQPFLSMDDLLKTFVWPQKNADHESKDQKS